MRQLLAIIRYELLMQLKSARFKGIIVLVILMGLGLYEEGARNQQLLPSHTFLSDEVLPFYLAAVVFAGLFAMGRIRKTGMHSILMVRPFHTFHLILGQTIAALLSLLIPLALIFFPTGLLLVWRTGIEYPLTPLFYIILFYFIPGICAVLSVTIWVRTCFKNNIMSLVILGLIFAGAVFVGNMGILTVPTPDGGSVHHFVPMLSLFSEFYWRQIAALETQTTFSFAQRTDWVNFGLSLAYSTIFLLLSCYHLRRTEPHRKVLGDFGKRWFHTPTFLKIACDLKIDPHLTWRSHLVLTSLFALVVYQSVWPIARPHWQNYQTAKKSEASGTAVGRYDKENIALMKLLPVTIVRDDQVMTPESLRSELTFTCSAETSGTVAVLTPWRRWFYKLDEISLVGNPVLFTRKDGYIFIEGEEFRDCADGAEHTLTIQGSKQADLMGENFGRNVFFNSRGYYFCKIKRYVERKNGDNHWRIDHNIPDTWPTRLNLSVDFDRPLVSAPVEPVAITDAAFAPLAESPSESEKSPSGGNGDPKAAWKTFIFDIPAARNGERSGILFLPLGQRIVEYGKSGLRLRIVVENRHVDIMKDILELADPMFEEFRVLHRVTYKEPIVISAKENHELRWPLNDIRRSNMYYRKYDNFHKWWERRLYDSLDRFEKEMLIRIRVKDLEGWGPVRIHSLWDLEEFLKNNLYRGLNHRLSLGKFESREYEPIPRRRGAAWALKAEKYSRQKLLEEGSSVPIFQMLYLVMGHDAWFRMLDLLKEKMHAGQLKPETLEEIALEAGGEDLTWFFEYWGRTGTGYPSYKIESAAARMYTTVEEEVTRYEIEAKISNLGTGRMPVPVRLTTSKKPVRDRVWIGPGETVTWKTTSPGLPKKMRVDPDGWILTVPYRSEEINDWVGEPVFDVEIEKTEVY